jgi:hypothetical protein
MGMFLMIMQLIGGLMPVIQSGILAVEQPGVSGADKAKAVTDLALGTLDAVAPGTVAAVGHNSIFAGIQSVIGSLVGHFNHTGVLPKKGVKPAAIAPVAAAASSPAPAPGGSVAGSAPGTHPAP